jgi:hypothetical protein
MTCTPVLAVILTDVQSLGGADVRAAPTIAHYATIQYACQITGQTSANIRQILRRYASMFDPARYQSSLQIAGKRKVRWDRRLLSARDIDTLRSMFPIIVK